MQADKYAIKVVWDQTQERHIATSHLAHPGLEGMGRTPDDAVARLAQAVEVKHLDLYEKHAIEFHAHLPGFEHITRDALDAYSVGRFAFGRDGLPLPCAVSIASSPSPFIIRIHGMFDLSTESFLKEKIRQAIEEHGAKQLILDFSYCKFIDSSGLSLILETSRRLKRFNGQLCLAHLSPQARHVFAVTRLDRIVPVLQ